MANLLDAAVAIAEENQASGRREPSQPELKRAVELTRKMVSGQATNTDRIVLTNLLKTMGTSLEDVFAAVQEEFR